MIFIQQQEIAKALVSKLVERGVLRLDVDSRKGWIDPGFWALIDAETKEKMTMAIAIYCNPDYSVIDLYDKQTAKEVASYGPFQGFKTF